MAPSETSSTLMLSPQRNVTFAVNYEVSQLDRYWQKNPPPARVERKPDSGVENVPEPTADGNPNRSNNTVTSTATRSSGVNIEKVTTTMDDPVRSPETTKTLTALSDEDMNSSGKENKKKVVIIKSPTQERQRRSTREQKKKEVPVERTRVRYDMELVPAVKRNRAFLDRFPLWSTPSDTRQDKIKRFHYRQQSIIREHQQKLQVVQKQPLEEKKQPIVKEPQVANNGWIVPGQPQSSSLIQDDDTSPELVDDEVLTPFEDDSSVIWVPKKRSEWEDSVLEMTAVCTSAAMRRHMATRGRIPSNKPFHPPLSKEYIRDRVDIDDPLQGYQIRHRTGGWLQGFILWTNFTTWTHFFKWDSSHAMSGIPTMNTGSTSSLVDADGSLAMELEHQPRSGDPFEGGVVFEAVAEISLVGGLGCGEYLLRMALDSIRAKRSYKFVVLQATDASKTFYERFGFVRVGAICRYERKDRDPSKPGSRPDTPIMGYRHWTHPNESDTSLQKHGGPSYMMCLKLPEDPPDAVIETPFLDEMMKLEVEHKPTIEQLGGTSTPHPKGKRGVLDPTTSDLPAEDQPTKNGPKRKIGRGRRGTNGSPATSTTTLAVNAASPPELPFLRGSGDNVPEQSTAKAAKSIGVKRNAEAGSAAALLTASAKKRRLVDDLTGQTKAGAPAKKTTSESKVARRTTRDRSNSNQSNPDQNAEGAAATETSEEETQPDGPVDVHAEADDKKVAAKKPVGKPIAKRTTPRRNSGPPPVLSSTPAAASIPTTATTTPIDKNAAAAAAAAAASRTGPMKQKVKSYPRDRVHFYNKVVRPKKGKNSENYFVLHYDEAKQTIRIIPMEPRGILSGKRAGRPRWQAVMTNLEKDSKTVRCADYEIVKAFMVMKTPVVASEAWDVLDA